MKKLVYTVAYILAMLCEAATCSSTAYGNTLQEESVPYIYESAAFPQRVRPSIACQVRHSFKLKVPKSASALSQISIRTPKGLRMSKKITVSDRSGRKINTDISVNSVDGRNMMILQFPEPIAPGTSLSIDMNNITMSGISNAWIYLLSVRFVGHDTDIPIGVVRYGYY